MLTNKLIKAIAYLIISLTLLSAYSALVRQVTYQRNEDLGLFKKSISFLSRFPGIVKDVLLSDKLKGIPPTYVEIDTTFVEINKLNYNLYGINSFYNNKTKEWDFKLFNFKNDSIIYKWHIKRDDYYYTYREFSNIEPNGTILLPDKSIIVLFAETNNLYRLDSLSNIIWHNTQKYFHHTMNLSVDSNIWVCSSNAQAIINGKHSIPQYYVDDLITKVDINSGEILWEKSISKIFLENDLKSLLFRYSNNGRIDEFLSYNDPLHLNDIEVAFNQTLYNNIGDLFLSLKHRGVVVQYRPKSNKVIRIIEGPFLNHHDVDIVSDNEIALFNNNMVHFGTFDTTFSHYINTINRDTIEFRPSYVLKYNMEKKEFSKFAPQVFENEQIITLNEGLQEFLSNGDLYVESQNEGKIYILNEKEIKLRKYFKSDIEGMVHQPHWIRIYENIDFLK